MSKQARKEDINDDELDPRQVRKYALIFISVVSVVFLVIWFGREWLASEEIIGTTSITIKGKVRSIQLSEKKGRKNFRDQMEQVEPGAPHYGYFLDLKDATSMASLSKVKFKSPVMKIQETPVIIVVGDEVWLVSTTRSEHREELGFILKFSITDDNLEPQVFELDEKYTIREVNGSRVYLSDGSGIFTTNHAMYGGLYLDLDTEKIMDDRRH